MGMDIHSDHDMFQGLAETQIMGHIGDLPLKSS